MIVAQDISEYKQKPVDESEEANTEVNDSNLFLITFVPLRLLGYINDCDENPRPSSLLNNHH